MQTEELINNWETKASENPEFSGLLALEAQKHPYSAPLQLLAYALAADDAPNLHELAFHAGIFFNNPLELESRRLFIRRKISSIKRAEQASQPAIQSQESSSVQGKKEDFLFEPLYTTDYFASQGIKLSEMPNPTDKLGKQLKSFTEWLKTMKKIQPNTTIQDSATLPDSMVEKMAEKSNIETDVITEAMAEVFIQQGKKDKAIETYEKLSLQNPAKSLYFADKIEQIKA